MLEPTQPWKLLESCIMRRIGEMPFKFQLMGLSSKDFIRDEFQWYEYNFSLGFWTSQRIPSEIFTRPIEKLFRTLDLKNDNYVLQSCDIISGIIQEVPSMSPPDNNLAQVRSRAFIKGVKKVE